MRGGFGIFVGPGQGEDLIQPIESDRVSTTLSSGALLAYPDRPGLLVANFMNNPNNRNYAPRAYASEYTIPEKVYQYTASVQQDLGGGFTATAAYVGSQGRNLFLRSVANQITQVVTNPNPANAAFVIREFSIVHARRERQRHRRAEPLRRDRLQDERRPRQLQRDDAVAEPPVAQRPGDEHAVHAGQEPRHVRRLERGEHGRQQRADRSRSSSTTTATTTSTSATRST